MIQLKWSMVYPLGEGTHTVNGKKITVDLYELKKLIWKAMMSVNILKC